MQKVPDRVRFSTLTATDAELPLLSSQRDIRSTPLYEEIEGHFQGLHKPAFGKVGIANEVTTAMRLSIGPLESATKPRSFRARGGLS